MKTKVLILLAASILSLNQVQAEPRWDQGYGLSAESNSIVGVWQGRTQPATQNSPAVSTKFTYQQDGSCRQEMAFAGGTPGQASGATIIQCSYEVTGNNIRTVVRGVLMCNGMYGCSPATQEFMNAFGLRIGQMQEGPFSLEGRVLTLGDGTILQRLQ
jgi:hypothetical protein